MTDRELDALVAKKVMGCKVIAESGDPWCGCVTSNDGRPYAHGDARDCNRGHLIELARYSTEIEAAWEVVERMRRRNYFLSCLGSGSDGYYIATFTHVTGNPKHSSLYGAIAPKAICRAALKAFGVEVKE